MMIESFNKDFSGVLGPAVFSKFSSFISVNLSFTGSTSSVLSGSSPSKSPSKSSSSSSSSSLDVISLD